MNNEKKPKLHLQNVKRRLYFIVSLIWILISPITLGALVPVFIAFCVTQNQWIVGSSYIIYAASWLWIHIKYVLHKRWFF